MTIYGQVIIICLKREEAGKRKVSSKKNGHTCFVDMSDLLTVGNTLQNGAFHNQFTVKWTKKGFLLVPTLFSECLVRKKFGLNCFTLTDKLPVWSSLNFRIIIMFRPLE